MKGLLFDENLPLNIQFFCYGGYVAGRSRVMHNARFKNRQKRIKGTRMYNFAYGSNMSTAYLRQYCPSAQPVMRAMLPNYAIQFRRYSTDLQGGISTIMEAPGQLVEGVIYEIPQAEIAALDILEDIPLGIYRRDTFLVLGMDGQWHHADLYRVVKPEGPFPVSARYLEYMIAGATEHGLSAEYIAGLIGRRVT
jgi:gamma-glutamylcyclotransferase (GGCT)/AIG2-like uncharacterized protein YtfP